MNFIFILIALVIIFIIWHARNIKRAKASCLSEEKKQKEYLKTEEKKELLAEEKILEQREARRQAAEDEERDRKAKVERDLGEVELRRKIKDRQDRQADEEKRKIG